VATSRRDVHESDLSLRRSRSVRDATRRRAIGRLEAAESKRTQARRAIVRRVASMRSAHRRDFAALLGPQGVRRYRALRLALAKAPRARRLRETRALLRELGADVDRVAALRRAHADALRRLLGDDVVRPGGLRPPAELPDSPWATYVAPFAGSFWSYRIERSGDVPVPVLARRVDTASAALGSSIRTRVEDAGDDSFVDVEYYTALHAWHTAFADGPIEGYVALQFRSSRYSGRSTDEYGFSGATYNQYARAGLKVTDPQGPVDARESRIFNVTGADEGHWDDEAASPGDVHWYYFRTSASFAQGRPLVLEAGVRNVTWFQANDMGVTIDDDLDLRLDRIMVRSVLLG
jgi:hypothetical protein